MNYFGQEGYCDRARRILAVRARLQEGVAQLGLEVWGRLQLCAMSDGSNALDIFAAAERLAQRGWFIGRLVDPPSIYLMLNLTHESAVEAYLADLAWAVEAVATAEEIATSREFTY